MLLEDSLRAVKVVSRFEGPVVDVGSGGGAPGIPLAAALPDREVTLLESSRHKCTFLERWARKFPNARVVCGRGLTMATGSPTRALSRVDLPTLGRPARATVPQRGMTASYPHPRKHEARQGESQRASDGEAGGGLLSHPLAGAVPSALTGLTTVFGMGTGVAPSR